jgi:hypothetical protein
MAGSPWTEKIEVREVRCLPMALRLSDERGFRHGARQWTAQFERNLPAFCRQLASARAITPWHAKNAEGRKGAEAASFSYRRVKEARACASGARKRALRLKPANGSVGRQHFEAGKRRAG